MPPDRPLVPTCLPHLQIMLTDDGSRTLRDRRLNETYHSGCGALQECLYVYLRNSGVESQLSAAQSSAVRVLELGFGTGLGWLVTASAAAAARTPVHYVSLETNLLPVEIFQQLDGASAIEQAIAAGVLPPNYQVARQLQNDLLSSLAKRPPVARQDTGLTQDTGLEQSSAPYLRLSSLGTTLELHLADARSWLDGGGQPFDALYFDAFSPATNPELWQFELLAKARRWLKPQGTLVSYCVSGQVRRQLEQAGFTVERRAGPPGGKREVLVARNRAQPDTRETNANDAQVSPE